jgi:hypothetical protein
LPICKVGSLWFAAILIWLGGSWSGSSSLPLRGRAVNVSASIVDSRSPSLALSDGTVHVVWEERNRVYHRSWDGRTWSSPASIAVGEQPALATDALGRAHVVFVNEFGGNYEIYHCRWNEGSWSLPRNVSNTSGVSSSPSLSIAADGTIHVVWADNTPGYSVIYHGYWNGTYWINEPMPHALGGAPAISVGTDGSVHVVWQDRDAPDAPYEIYYSRRLDGSWSLPEDLSDTSAEQSIIPSVALDGDGQAHVVWQERVDTNYTIHYTRGTVGYWSIPEQVSEGEADAYLPSLSVREGSTVYVGWDESTLVTYRQRGLAEFNWSECTSVSDDPRGVAELLLAIDGAGQLHAVWTRLLGGNWDVFYQSLAYRLALPQMLKGHPR